jgi:ABC-type glucose/galactose transport system permease subunit
MRTPKLQRTTKIVARKSSPLVETIETKMYIMGMKTVVFKISLRVPICDISRYMENVGFMFFGNLTRDQIVITMHDHSNPTNVQELFPSFSA